MPAIEPNPILSIPTDSATASTLPQARLEVAALLSVSGGFLDAFTYVGHGPVFVNAMTGMAARILSGHFDRRAAWPSLRFRFASNSISALN